MCQCCQKKKIIYQKRRLCRSCYAKSYYGQNRQELKQAARRWQVENKSHVQKYQAHYRVTHEKQLQRYAHAYRVREAERYRKYNQTFYRENKGYFHAKRMLRLAQIKNAIPARLSKSHRAELVRIYSEKPSWAHIDHVIPLSHPQVCGLHVPWNLQYLSPIENLSKSNQFDGTCDNNTWRHLFARNRSENGNKNAISERKVA